MTSNRLNPSCLMHEELHENECCWPFCSDDIDTKEACFRQVISRRSLGNIYSIRLTPSQQDDDISYRPGQSQKQGSRILGRLCSAPMSLVESEKCCLCLHRFKVWWMRPVFCSPNKIPPETVFLLYRSNESEALSQQECYRLVLAVPIPGNDGELVTCVLNQCSNNNGVLVLSASSSNSMKGGLYCGVGSDPFELIREGTKLAKQLLEPNREHGKTRANPFQEVAGKEILGVHNSLGWCTWNAFYTNVSATKVIDGVQELHSCHHVPIRWLILDDGWQHTTNDGAENGQQWSQRLKSMRASPRFETNISLRESIQTLKEQQGLHSVWAWHTLVGYWLGLDPASLDLPASTLNFPHFPPGILDNDPSASREASVEMGIGIPDSPQEFYDQYHGYLKDSMVDGVKVDAQGVIGTLRKCKWNDKVPSATPKNNHVIVMGLQNALASNMKNNFGSKPQQESTDDLECDIPPVMQCMAHAPEIFYRLPSLYPQAPPWMRVSDDHYPNNPYSHGPHVVACAFNSLLLSQFARPDWDMFTTSNLEEEAVKLHAVARAISGGLVYLSDAPSKHIRRDVIGWLSCNDGMTLPCRQAALPVAKCLLADPLSNNADPLIIWNTNGQRNGSITSGVLGVFHLAGSGEWDYDKLDYGPCPDAYKLKPKTLRVRPTDIPCYSQNEDDCREFVARFFFQNRICVLPLATAEFAMELQPGECDAIAIIPISRFQDLQFFALGLAGMLNGAGSVLKVTATGNKLQEGAVLTLLVRGSGSFLVAFRQTIKEINNGIVASVTINGILVAHKIYRANTKDVPSNIPCGIFEAGFQILSFELPPRDKFATTVYRCVSISFSADE